MSEAASGLPSRLLMSRTAIVVVALGAWVMLLAAHGHHEDSASIPWLTWAWVLMTAGMMLPSTLPMVGAFGRVAEKLDPHGVSRSTVAFVVEYLILWIGFSAACASAQATLAGFALLDDGMGFSPPVLSGALLVGGGLFQL